QQDGSKQEHLGDADDAREVRRDRARAADGRLPRSGSLRHAVEREPQVGAGELIQSATSARRQVLPVGRWSILDGPAELVSHSRSDGSELDSVQLAIHGMGCLATPAQGTRVSTDWLVGGAAVGSMD